ncbi:MAG: hypothetical protein KDK27_17710, partial [Leptospiraceae bacterium]|nr:hypothetical protein [Leptospiraceae bacterium]
IGALYKIWSSIPSGIPFRMIAGLGIMSLIVLFISFLIINILLIRADDIAGLPQAKDYNITPIAVVILKMTGEVLAATYATLGIALGVVYLVGGEQIRALLSVVNLPGLGALGSSWVLIMVMGPVMGVIVLFIAYYLAEQMGALVDIARNTSKGR